VELGVELLGESVEVEAPALVAVDSFADAFPAVAVAVEVAVLELDARAVRGLGDEAHLDFAGPVWVGLELSVGADVPAEDDPVRRLVGEHTGPAALAAVDAAVDDVAPDVRLEHGLGDLDLKQVVFARLEAAEVICEDRERAVDGGVNNDLVADGGL
jgi:hypothetical protein